MIAKQRQKRVLLVDDDEGIVEVMGDGLRRRGYSVKSYSDPLAVLLEFAPHAYDVAILDVRMGGMDGIELYRRLKGLDPHMAICFVSAYSDSIENKPDGVLFLQKPIALSDLVRALEES